jgi:regulatory protein
LRLLNDSPKSRAQLAAAMDRRGVSPDVAEKVLDRFEEVGLVDDAALAGMIVRARHTERGLAGPALAADLRRRGVDKETAQQAMAQVTPESEQQRALDLATRKLAATRGLDRQVRLRRTYALLARKGYPSETAHQAITQALSQDQ